MPARERVFAAVPGCGNDHPKCEDGVIVEYDTRDFSRAWRHRIFTNDFYARLEQVVCLEDEVQVGMCCTKGSGMDDDEATITWSPSSPQSYERHGLEATARRLVFDPSNNAVFYVGDRVTRIDRDTGESSDELQRLLLSAAARKGTTYPGQKRLFMAESGALFPEWKRLYIGEFGRGSRIFEVDLDSLEVVSTLVANNGGVIAATVDRDNGHLWVVGLYGLEIYDLNAGVLVTRRRTGTLPRAPVIDRIRDVVYVPTTVEGRIAVFHRTTFRRLGRIPIGLETRNCFLTEDGRWFLASAAREHFVWDAGELASRFLPPS
jgi:hypothetical protein